MKMRFDVDLLIVEKKEFKFQDDDGNNTRTHRLQFGGPWFLKEKELEEKIETIKKLISDSFGDHIK